MKLELTARELKELQQLLRGYDYNPLPKWLLLETKLTIRRRRFVQAVLFEAGVGHDMCWFEQQDWAFELHKIWHKLFNGVEGL